MAYLFFKKKLFRTDGRTHGRTNEGTDGRSDYIMPKILFGGIKSFTMYKHRPLPPPVTVSDKKMNSTRRCISISLQAWPSPAQILSEVSASLMETALSHLQENKVWSRSNKHKPSESYAVPKFWSKLVKMLSECLRFLASHPGPTCLHMALLLCLAG